MREVEMRIRVSESYSTMDLAHILPATTVVSCAPVISVYFVKLMDSVWHWTAFEHVYPVSRH